MDEYTPRRQVHWHSQRTREVQVDINGQVLGVQGRTTRSGKTLYDVAFSDGQKYTTFDTALATKAQQLFGQEVSARVEVKQNGNFTNYNLVDIAPLGALPPAPIVAGTPIGIGTVPQNGEGKKFTEDDATRIAKQGALGQAANLVAGLFQGAGPEAFEQALELTIEAGRRLYKE